jgi:hypothetical protein
MSATLKKPNPFLELILAIAAPALILMKFSDAEHLGPMRGLLVALLFPLGYGIWDAVRRKKLNLIAALGVFSTLLTGGIGLMKLDAEWLVIKEGVVHGAIALLVLGSAWTGKPLIKLLVFNPDLFDVERINKALAERGNTSAFDACLRKGTLLLGGTFVFSTIAKVMLTKFVVSSPAGTAEFNQELGRLTLLSYPLIALPSMIMMMALLWWLGKQAKGLTGMALEDMLAPA